MALELRLVKTDDTSGARADSFFFEEHVNSHGIHFYEHGMGNFDLFRGRNFRKHMNFDKLHRIYFRELENNSCRENIFHENFLHFGYDSMRII